MGGRMKIGIFDSGIGGLTVLKEALRVLPDESFLYYADSENVPYGTKNRSEVRQYIFDGVAFMAAQGLKALVIACNTATSIAVADLRRVYTFPILGMEPAVKPAISYNEGKRVLVLATPLALKEEKFINLVSRLDAENIVDPLPLPELVDFAESMTFDRDIVIPCLKQKFSAFDLNQYGTVVLGCTHFPFFKEYFEEIFPEGTHIIDGSAGTVRYLNQVLHEKGLIEGKKLEKTDVEFYISGGKAADRSRFLKCLELFK